MYNPVKTGNRIRECRQLKHLTQEQAAEALSISIKHYSEIERGITGLSFDMFIKLCDLYTVSADFLFEYSRAVTPPVRQTGNRLSRLTETAFSNLFAQVFI